MGFGGGVFVSFFKGTLKGQIICGKDTGFWVCVERLHIVCRIILFYYFHHFRCPESDDRERMREKKVQHMMVFARGVFHCVCVASTGSVGKKTIRTFDAS